MERDQFISVLDELWPGNDLPDMVTAELARRVAQLPLTTEQVLAALTEYRINCPKYEVKTPNAGAIGKLLRGKAYPPDPETKSPGGSDYHPTPLSGPVVTYSEWCAYAKAHGIKNHLTTSKMRELTAREEKR